MKFNLEQDIRYLNIKCNSSTYLNRRFFNFLNFKGINNPNGKITNKKECHDLSPRFRSILKYWNKTFLFGEDSQGNMMTYYCK